MKGRARRWAGLGSAAAVATAIGALLLGDPRAVLVGTRVGATQTRPTPAPVGEFRGEVVAVRDGDTIVVRRKRRTVRVRVFGVDCPEHDQPYGAQATAFTRARVDGREVTVVERDRDIYGRTVGEVVLPGGEDLGTALIGAGLAWHYRRYSHAPALDALEDQARAAHRGLWADPHPVPPWEFRHAKH